ncbi:MAG: ABC transporter ATP-binding protein [Bacteroidales bacterium]
MINYNDITFSYGGNNLFEDFNLTIADNEHVCIAGRSGVGKSTLLNFLTGFLQPQKGSIEVNGILQSDDNIQLIRNQILWLPQDINLPFLNVRELLQFHFQFKVNRKKSYDESKALELFDTLGLDRSLIDHDIAQLSGGQKQRIAFIAGILTDKQIYLLDEPTAALDPESTVLMGTYLQSCTDRTIMAISHDENIKKYFDRTITL